MCENTTISSSSVDARSQVGLSDDFEGRVSQKQDSDGRLKEEIAIFFGVVLFICLKNCIFYQKFHFV